MKRDLITLVLANPRLTEDLGLGDWDLLLRQARAANLLARLAASLAERNLLETVPEQPRQHLHSALIYADAQTRAVRREVAYLAQELNSIGIELVLLKGTAYVMADLPASKGRRFADIDILVPHERLSEVEAHLMLNGWASTHHSPYDQRYYREWMHELPPMLHIKRLIALDVHHAIVPATADLKPDATLLLAAATPVPGHPGISTLCPADMVLHSATHLFYNEEFSHGLRDMSDLDLLLRHFAVEKGFWETLLDRSQQLGLTRPLYYCLRYCTYLFSTPVPGHILHASDNAAPQGWLARIMDKLWLRALRSQHPSAAGMRSSIAQWMLYVRAHWHKMPVYLLIYHLLVKPRIGSGQSTH